MSDRSDTPLRQVLMVSRAPADAGQTDAAVARMRELLAAAGLTGALLFSGGHFVQVVEGPPDAMLAAMAEIEAQAGPGGLTVLLCRGVAQRRFPSWHQGWLDLDGADDLLRSLMASAPPSPGRAERLLTHLEALIAGAAAVSGRA